MKTLEELNISPVPWRNTIKSKIPLESGFVWDALSDGILTGGYAESLNDARLIAASPYMYKYGAELVLALENWMQLYPPSEFSTFGQAYQLLVKAVNNLRAALAKAAGESEVK